MLLSGLFFLSIFSFFLSATSFKLLLLFGAFFSFLITTHLLITVSTLSTLFNHYILIYKFEFLNLSYSLLFDGITLYFILLTLLLFIICILLG